MHEFREVTEIEIVLRALIPEIREKASRNHHGHGGAAIYRSANHDVTEDLRDCLDAIFGQRDRLGEKITKSKF